MVVIISISKDFIVVLILAQWIECEKCDACVTTWAVLGCALLHTQRNEHTDLWLELEKGPSEAEGSYSRRRP